MIAEESRSLPLSTLAETLQGSEIINLAAEVKKQIAAGKNITNLTIGDFNAKLFPIPTELKQGIVDAYMDDHTNYPPSNGIPELRESVSTFLDRNLGLKYSPDQVLISGGARPLIYAAYRAIVDQDDAVIYPTPSWNNNHYTTLNFGKQIAVPTQAENKFMPTANDIAPHIQNAALVAVCSPLNPTGTAFTKKDLSEICELILQENRRRGPGSKPLYLIYDQIYWQLTYGIDHVDPVNLYPEMKDYTIYIDGISKAFCATGVRVGWAFGPEKIIGKMKSILGHVGAWSPKAEQVATAQFLQNEEAVSSFLASNKAKIKSRLDKVYEGFLDLKKKGYAVDAIAPEAAMYLTVAFNLRGQKGLNSTEEITAYLLNEAGLAIVPFYAFGSSRDETWYRISVGTLDEKEVSEIFSRLELALSKLK